MRRLRDVLTCSVAVASLLLFTCCNGSTSANGGNSSDRLLVKVSACNTLATSTDCSPLAGALASGSFLQNIAGVTPVGGNGFFSGVSQLSGYLPALQSAKIPAVWNMEVSYSQPAECLTLNPKYCFCPSLATALVTLPNLPSEDDWICEYQGSTGAAVVFANNIPTTVTVNAPQVPFVTTYGMPTLYLYQQNVLDPVGSVVATSVASNGSTATFPFPVQSNGSPLQTGMYSTTVYEPDPAGSGTQLFMGLGSLTIGTDSTSQTTPYAVTAYDVGTSQTTYINDDGSSSTTTTPISSVPGYVLTLAGPGQVCLGGGACGQVGTDPVALATYGSTTTVLSDTGGCTVNYVDYEYYCDITVVDESQPSEAIVANYGSNNISVVALPAMTVTATIPVGTSPVSVAVNGTMAYVANYNANSVSEINLTNNSVAATLGVGTGPSSVTVDPSGNYLWVAGYNYITKVNLPAFTIASVVPVSGQVTSLAISAAQNSWVYTAVSDDLSTMTAEDAVITSGTPVLHPEAEVSTSGTDYVITQSGGTPPPFLKASAVVSSNFGNGLAVTSTPTGFAVLDLVNHKVLESETTASPVRGIAVDPGEQMAYLAAPESNTFITIALPQPDVIQPGVVQNSF